MSAHEQAIASHTEAITDGRAFRAAGEVWWNIDTAERIGSGVLRQVNVHPPVYEMRFTAEVDADDMTTVELYRYVPNGTIISAVRANVSIDNLVDTHIIGEVLGPQLNTSAAEPGPQDYALLADMLAQAPRD